MGQRAEIGIVVQLQSAAECGIGFAKRVEPESILVGQCAEIDVVVQLQSASKCNVNFEKLERPRSVVMGEGAEAGIGFQLESASECDIGFAEFNQPESILTSKYSEINVVLSAESWTIQFRELSIREFSSAPFFFLHVKSRFGPPVLRGLAIRRRTSIGVGCRFFWPRSLVWRRRFWFHTGLIWLGIGFGGVRLARFEFTGPRYRRLRLRGLSLAGFRSERAAPGCGAGVAGLGAGPHLESERKL